MYVQEAKPIVVNLTPPEVKIEAGGQPVEVIAEVRNAGETADQYSLEIENLDPSWYTITGKSVALFPGDSAPIPIKIHPPRSKDTRAGHHAFQVVARSQADPMSVGKTKGIVVVGSYAVFNMELAPARATGYRGKYRLKLANGGNSELQLGLETADAEDNLSYGLKTREPMIRSGSTMVMPLTVRPKGLHLVGEGDRYKFTLTGTPTDGNPEDAKQVQGELVHKPPFATWKLPLILLVALLLLIGFFTFGSRVSSGLCSQNALLYGGEAVSSPIHLVWSLACQGYKSPTTPTPSSNGQSVVFDHGFKEFHDNQPDLVGSPLDNEYPDRSNAAITHQDTTNGHLVYIPLVKPGPDTINASNDQTLAVGYFTSKKDGKVYLFQFTKAGNHFYEVTQPK